VMPSHAERSRLLKGKTMRKIADKAPLGDLF
jgi:hypothetical protein